jgi:hypothetical protein
MWYKTIQNFILPPLTYDSPFEKLLRISNNQHNPEMVQDKELILNFTKGNRNVSNYTASNIETYLHRILRLAVSKQMASRLHAERAGSAGTSNIPHDDGDIVHTRNMGTSKWQLLEKLQSAALFILLLTLHFHVTGGVKVQLI